MLYGVTPRPAFRLEPNQHVSNPPPITRKSTVRTEYDARRRALWLYMSPRPRPCFTPELLADILAAQDNLRRDADNVDFFVAASDIPGVFNLGGDLSLFQRAVAAKDSAALMHYAERCVQALYGPISGFGSGITSIALLQGDALGGGLEAALSCHIVVAERGVKMGFPEIMFNLFPGMGALSFVARRAGQRVAERLILDGEILPAEEMHELGLVDHLAEKGEGVELVQELIRRRSRASNGLRAFQRARMHTPLSVPYEELLAVTREWVDAACRLESRDLRIMDRLIKAQDRLAGATASATEPEFALAGATASATEPEFALAGAMARATEPELALAA